MGYAIIDTETATLIQKLKDIEIDLKGLGFNSIEELPICFQFSFIYDNGKRTITRDSIGKPPIDIEISCSEITGVTNKMLKKLTLNEDGTYLKISETPELEEFKSIIEKDKDLFMVGHNVGYDIDVLSREGVDLSKVKIIDTLQLSKILNKDNEYHRLQYLLYSNDDLVDELRELFETDLIKSISKFDSTKGHNSLFDVFTTKKIFDEFKNMMLEQNLATEDNYLEVMHNLSINPILLEEIPYGKSKGQRIEEMDTISLLWFMKMEITDINLKYTLDKTMDDRGGYDKVLGSLTVFDINKFFNVMDNFTNEDFKELLNNELKKRDNVITLGFGKFANTPIAEVKESYLTWVLENNKNEKTLSNIREELEKRKVFSNEIDSSLDLEKFLDS